MKKTLLVILATMMALTLAIGFSITASADQPAVTESNGAYVRLLGTPENGTVKFQYGWEESTPASSAAGYWLGIYDVTDSHYVWSFDTGAFADPIPELFLNAQPTPKLPPGDYYINFFVRSAYPAPPAPNIATITIPFTVLK